MQSGLEINMQNLKRQEIKKKLKGTFGTFFNLDLD